MCDDLIQEIGLLLTQLRYARRALEDVERSTSRYNSFAFAAALGQGARFGEPPMFSGALKVWVVNINDLAPGAGGGFLEQLLGGIGRFIGGVGSGFAGGALGGLFGMWNLPFLISKLESLAAHFDSILTKLGIDFSAKSDKDKDKDKDKKDGPGFIQQLDSLTGILKTFTALFEAGAGKPEKAEGISSSLSDGAKQWMQIVTSTSELMLRIDRVVQGLTILIPTVVAALADLIVRLDSLKLAIVELLQFALRELLLLRGVLLVTVFETISAVLKLASSILGVLSVAFSAILTSVFAIFKQIFDAVIATIKFLADGLEATIDALARYLVDVLTNVLFAIGDTLVFREIVHIVQVLPLILPSLVLAIQGTSAVPFIDSKGLNKAATMSAAHPILAPGASAAATVPTAPTISPLLLPPKDVAGLDATLKGTLEGVTKSIKDVFGTGKSALDVVAKGLDESAKDKSFTDALGGYIGPIKQSSEQLAAAFDAAQKSAADAAAKKDGSSGLQKIAEAYETWLSGKGLTTLLDDITTYFKRPGAADALKDRAIPPTVIDRPRATIDIQDVIIEIEPPSAHAASEGTASPDPLQHKAAALHTPEDTLTALVELIHELNERGFHWDKGSLLTQI